MKKILLNSYLVHFGGRLFTTTAWSDWFFFIALQIFKPPLIVGNPEIKMYWLTLSLLAADMFSALSQNGKGIGKGSRGPYSTFSLWLTFVGNIHTDIHSDTFFNVFVFREEVKLVPWILLPAKTYPQTSIRFLLPVASPSSPFCLRWAGVWAVWECELDKTAMLVWLHTVRFAESVMCGAVILGSSYVKFNQIQQGLLTSLH